PCPYFPPLSALSAVVGAVQAMIPDGAPVLLVGDTAFEAVGLQAQVAAWGWHYVLRQKPNNQVQVAQQATWQAFRSLVTAPGQRVWVPDVRLTRVYGHPAKVLAEWAVGERTPWLLSTNLSTASATLRAYRRRMWLEELFGDLKGHGFDLEQSHLRHFARLSRLTLAVVLLYAWCVTIGKHVIKRGLRTLVDRNDRRDLSVFQIGLRYLLRRIKHGQPVPVVFAPGLPKLSGS
ncbi:MAG: transposase, partial [Chloroflexaceae bacterium]